MSPFPFSLTVRNEEATPLGKYSRDEGGEKTEPF